MTITRPTRRRRHLLAALLCSASIAAGVSAPNAHAAQIAAPPPAPTEQLLDTDAKPVLNWSVPDRFTASWAAWNPTNARYDASIINPQTWSLTLDGCSSTPVHRITGYEFAVTQVGGTWTRTYERTGCTLALRNVLPAQGIYRAALTLHTASDSGLDGVSLPTSKVVEIRDHLIVSMGDSLASGEGNPDVPGSYSYGVDASLNPTVSVERAVRWKDARCHRSAKSGPSLAAKAIEDASPFTSVTFVSLACSGAEVRHLTTDPYRGIAPEGSLSLPPQVDAVAALVGPSSPRGGRQIDALLVSAGINDLGFSDIIKRCVLNNNFAVEHTSCVRESGIADKVYELTRQYAYLALGLAVKLPNTREVYFNNYPSQVFRGGACGLLAGVVPSKGIDAAEGEEMNTWGLALSAKVTKATDTFRTNQYRWNRIADLAEPFRTHAYCDSPTWFTSLERSLATQGDVNGTAHPNAEGHVQYGKLLRNAIVVTQASHPYRRVTITLEAMKAPAGAGVVKVDPVFQQYQNDPYGLTRPLSVPRNGAWTPVAPEIGTYTFDTYVAPASPRHAVALTVTLGHVLTITHGRNDNYGHGFLELTHPAGNLAVRYRITSVPVGPPGNAPAAGG